MSEEANQMVYLQVLRDGHATPLFLRVGSAMNVAVATYGISIRQDNGTRGGIIIGPRCYDSEDGYGGLAITEVTRISAGIRAGPFSLQQQLKTLRLIQLMFVGIYLPER